MLRCCPPLYLSAFPFLLRPPPTVPHAASPLFCGATRRRGGCRWPLLRRPAGSGLVLLGWRLAAHCSPTPPPSSRSRSHHLIFLLSSPPPPGPRPPPLSPPLLLSPLPFFFFSPPPPLWPRSSCLAAARSAVRGGVPASRGPAGEALRRIGAVPSGCWRPCPPRLVRARPKSTGPARRPLASSGFL